MRPYGVRERMRELARRELDAVESWTNRRLRVRLTTLIDACARLVFNDHPVSTVLGCYRQVDIHLGNPSQIRTGTDFELRSLRCVAELRPVIGEMSARPIEDVPFAEQDRVWEELVLIPPQVILGDTGPDCQFTLVCWNQANAVAERVQAPYRAARSIVAEGFHEPADAFGLIGTMTELTERYEDEPDARDPIAAQIVDALATFRAAAPWPIRERPK